MQTFLPWSDFNKTVKDLDYRRLGKQRVEAFQILNILTGNTNKKGWINHPAVKMWSGYEESLKLYMNTCIKEWIHRGYKNNMLLADIDMSQLKYPWWMNNHDFHRAHRSRLIQKNTEYYLPKFPQDENFNDSQYLWPDNDTKTFKHI